MSIRIIGGEHARRVLRGPDGEDVTRPLTARVRESLFAMLRGHVEGERVFDAFAGVGTFGLEAASRGAGEVVMVERDRRIAKVLRGNARELGVSEEQGGVCRVVEADALGPAGLAACPDPVHLVYVDPPYPMMWEGVSRGRVLGQLSRLVGRLDETGYAMLRTPWPLFEGGGVAVDGGADAGEDGAAVVAERVDVSGALDAIAGAAGPETHVYGSMAVHLYMRAG